MEYLLLSPLLLLVFAVFFVPLTMLLALVAWVMFFVVFPPYALLLSLVLGPMGLLSAFLSVLYLSRKLMVLFLKALFFSQVQAVMFDAVLTREGLYNVVFGHNLKKEQSSGTIDVPGFLANKLLPFIVTESLLLLVHFVPIVGPFLVLFIRAPTKANSFHQRYFKLMEWNFKAQNNCFWKYRLEYTQFGVMALLLEMIPGFTLLFMFTNNIGMALWSVENHDKFQEFGGKYNGPVITDLTAPAVSVITQEPEEVIVPAPEVRRREYLKLPLNTMRARIWVPRVPSADKPVDPGL